MKPMLELKHLRMKYEWTEISPFVPWIKKKNNMIMFTDEILDYDISTGQSEVNEETQNNQ